MTIISEIFFIVANIILLAALGVSFLAINHLKKELERYKRIALDYQQAYLQAVSDNAFYREHYEKNTQTES